MIIWVSRLCIMSRNQNLCQTPYGRQPLCWFIVREQISSSTSRLKQETISQMDVPGFIEESNAILVFYSSFSSWDTSFKIQAEALWEPELNFLIPSLEIFLSRVSSPEQFKSFCCKATNRNRKAHNGDIRGFYCESTWLLGKQVITDISGCLIEMKHEVTVDW